MNFPQEVELKIVDYAGQVALEFLRANPEPKTASVVENYNRIFKQVYKHMLEVVSK